MHRLWLVPALALFLLSGCTECGTPFSPYDVPDDAPSSGGPGSRIVTVQVNDDQGPAPSSLIAWWVQNEGDLGTADPLILETLLLRSEDGAFEAHVPTGRTIHLVAASDSTQTQEWVLDALAPGESPASFTIHLYERTLEWSVEGTWKDAAGALCSTVDTAPCSSDGDEDPWKPHALQFSDDPVINQGYLERMTFLSGQLSWENTPGDAASFGVGFGVGDGDLVCFIDDSTEDPRPATHSQSFGIPDQDQDCNEDLGWSPQSNPTTPLSHVGPRATYLAAPVEGVSYELSGDAGFYHWNPIFDMCDQYGGREYRVEEAPYRPPTFEDSNYEDSQADPNGEPGTTASPPGWRGIGIALGFAVLAGLFVVIVLAVRRSQK